MIAGDAENSPTYTSDPRNFVEPLANAIHCRIRVAPVVFNELLPFGVQLFGKTNASSRVGLPSSLATGLEGLWEKLSEYCARSCLSIGFRRIRVLERALVL